MLDFNIDNIQIVASVLRTLEYASELGISYLINLNKLSPVSFLSSFRNYADLDDWSIDILTELFHQFVDKTEISTINDTSKVIDIIKEYNFNYYTILEHTALDSCYIDEDFDYIESEEQCIYDYFYDYSVKYVKLHLSSFIDTLMLESEFVSQIPLFLKKHCDIQNCSCININVQDSSCIEFWMLSDNVEIEFTCTKNKIANNFENFLKCNLAIV